MLIFIVRSLIAKVISTQPYRPDHSFTDAGMHEMLEGLASLVELYYLGLFGMCCSRAYYALIARRKPLQRTHERAAAPEATRVVAYNGISVPLTLS